MPLTSESVLADRFFFYNENEFVVIDVETVPPELVVRNLWVGNGRFNFYLACISS